MNEAAENAGRGRWISIAAGFLAISYGIGGPLTAFVEFRSHAISERFELPPELIYLTCVVQLVCSVTLFSRQLAAWSAAALTVITLGAAASHLKVGSPLTAIPALFYTAVQVWFAIKSHRQAPHNAADE